MVLQFRKKIEKQYFSPIICYEGKKINLFYSLQMPEDSHISET